MNKIGKKILVTGGCGYIGSHVARAFKQDNPTNEVTVIDQVERKHTLNGVDGWRIDDFASDSSLALMIDKEFDIIVHCAGTSLVGPSLLDPSTYWDNNVVKTKRMLDALKGLSKSPIIMFSSSASVYGEPERLPIPESHPKRPLSPYGNTKLTVEYMLDDYCKAYDMRAVIFRYFNAAGAMPDTFDLGQEKGATHIIAKVLEAQLAGSDFWINGINYNTPDRSCVRDYVHVWDIALAHVAAAKKYDLSEYSHNYYADRFNLGTGKGISNLQIVDYVRKNIGELSVTVDQRRAGDPSELIADPTKANEELDWYPKYSDLSTIINTAYRWYTRV